MNTPPWQKNFVPQYKTRVCILDTLQKGNICLTLAEGVMKISSCTGVAGKSPKSNSTSALSGISIAVTAQHSCAVALAR